MTIYVQEAATLFVGDHDPINSKHLTLKNHKLPTLEEGYEDHTPGGGFVGIEVGTGKINKLESSFDLNGEDPRLLSQFGFGVRRPLQFFSYGVIRDLRTGEAIEGRATLVGYLGSIEPDEYSPGAAKGGSYGIKGITSYEMSFDGEEKFFFDFWTNTVRIDGANVRQAENSILRLG